MQEEPPLTEEAVRNEIVSYAQQHPNDFGITTDGRERIPMKKLMKLFSIKKKSPMEKQNLFRVIVNKICDLEMIEDAKVLVLKKGVLDLSAQGLGASGSGSGDRCFEDEACSHRKLGYGEAAPTVSDGYSHSNDHGKSHTRGRTASIPEPYYPKPNPNPGNLNHQRRHARRGSRRFLPPHSTHSGNLSVATVDSIGVYSSTSGDGNRIGSHSSHSGSSGHMQRRIGYRRRGSVTRYSISAQNAVLDEYQKHEDVLNQFRKDSAKIESSMRSLSMGTGRTTPGPPAAHGATGGGSNHSSRRSGSVGPSEDTSGRSPRRRYKQAPQERPNPNPKKAASAVRRFFRRGRFSLAF